MRYSRQREVILTTLKDNPCHPTADYIYGLIRKDNPNISLGTVYRNLSILANKGIIKRVKGLDNKERFDHNTFDHAHIKCTCCGRVEDIMLPREVAQSLDNLQVGTDFKINNCEILMQGLCSDCKK
jgi:Fur family peroxide stress response transcriptional regulator